MYVPSKSAGQDTMGWNSFWSSVWILAPTYVFIILNMDFKYVPPGQSSIKFRVVDHFKGKKIVDNTITNKESQQHQYQEKLDRPGSM